MCFTTIRHSNRLLTDSSLPTFSKVPTIGLPSPTRLKLGIRRLPTLNATKLALIQIYVTGPSCRLEQHRIVAKIEELFSELDKGVESLKTTRAKLNVYRQTVLKHAFEGKLTVRWREENKDKLETPEQLLARIKQERGARYEQQLQEWKTAVKKWEGGGKRGRKPRKPHAPNLTTEFSKNFAVESDKLPFGWAWAEIGALFDVVSGATPKGLDQATGSDMPFYKVSDMNTSGNETRMDTSAIYLSEPERIELGLTAYPEGTVIFPKRGGAILTNKKRILSHPACFDLNTMGVVNSIASISKRYLWHWFQSLDLAKIYDGSNVPQINNKNVEPLPFPICSIEEQREIASILEKTFSVLDETEAEVVQELRKAAALRQSILKKAFAGQLVPQDPDDEPASILLERIKAEKAAQVSQQHGGKTQTHGGNSMTGKLPININHLLRQRAIEGERVEYKGGWNAKAMRQNGSPEPVFESDEDRTWFLVRLPMHERAANEASGQDTLQDTPQDTLQDTGQVTAHVEQLVAVLTGKMSRAQIQAALQLKDRNHFTIVYLKPALEAGLIEMTLPGKPTSRNQRYRRTAAKAMPWLDKPWGRIRLHEHRSHRLQSLELLHHPAR